MTCLHLSVPLHRAHILHPAFLLSLALSVTIAQNQIHEEAFVFNLQLLAYLRDRSNCSRCSWRDRAARASGSSVVRVEMFSVSVFVCALFHSYLRTAMGFEKQINSSVVAAATRKLRMREQRENEERERQERDNERAERTKRARGESEVQRVADCLLFSIILSRRHHLLLLPR